MWRHITLSITELSQRAPPIFGWADITLGIGRHSSLLYTSARPEPAPLGWYWRSVRHMTRFHTRRFLLSRWDCSPFRDSNPPKKLILMSWIGISNLTRKMFKLLYYRNYCVDSDQIVKTIKYSSSVVQTCVQQIQDGGRPPCWKPLSRTLSAAVRTFENPRWQTAAIF